MKVGRSGLGVLLLLGCTLRLPESNPLQTKLTVDREKEIGAEVHEQIRQSGALVTDLILLDYINDLGQQIVRVTEPQPFIYRFNLVRSDALNAFAVPGGYIYIHTAVLAQAGDVSELAGVLAHEVAHVRRRHIAKAQENQWVAQLATLAALVLSGGHPGAAVIAEGINVSLLIQHTRENESDADRNGIEYMVRAGYDPTGMIHFFQRLVAAYGPTPGEIPPYLFTHPELKERIPAARVTIERGHTPRGLVRTDPRLDRVQERLAALLSPMAGGSGLQARSEFERSKTDPLLERAEQAFEQGRFDDAEALLRQAALLEARDPRPPLRLADLAERRGNLLEAAAQLHRALEIDPTVALVHYRLGLAHKRLGNRSRAAFHLEQAAARFGPSSSLRKRTRLEIHTLSFPVFDTTGLGTRGPFGKAERTRFHLGQTVLWWGSVSRQFIPKNPVIRVRWIDPEGQTAQDDRVRMDPFGRVSASLDTHEAPPGRWEVRIHTGESELERRTFLLTDQEKS